MRGTTRQSRGTQQNVAAQRLADAANAVAPHAPDMGRPRDLGATPSSEPARPAARRTVDRATFQAKLREGVARARDLNIGFGRAVANTPMFDTEFFVMLGGDASRFLRLVQGTPAAAIDAIFSRPNKWRFDCFEFAQVVRLFALREAYGRDQLGTNQFNALVARGAANQSDPRLEIRPEPGGGLPIALWYTAPLDAKTSRFVAGPLQSRGKGPAKAMSQEEAMAADLGALVTFHNPECKADAASAAWHNENAVALGGGEFVAWGIPPYVVDAPSITGRLAAHSVAKDGAGSIFVSGVSMPDVPWSG